MSDSSFAYVDSKGVGHLPINDEGHVRAALGRFNQTQFENPEDKAKAARKIKAAASKMGIEVADDSAVAKAAMAEAAVLALRFGEQATLAEGQPIDYLCTGEWTFASLNDGKPITVTRDDLAVVKRLFDENAYGQHLPIIDEHHDPNRAVGWIKSLDWHPSDPERLVAYPDWNEGSDKLVESGQYAYTSPVLLLNWRNPETGEVHPVVPGGIGLDPADPAGGSGLALTNHPKIKRLSARFVAGEKASAAVVGFSEAGTVHDGKPADCVRALLADMDADGDDDGPVPCCIYQPPYGHCPGYTRWPGDTDGDGVCLMATRDCNGYIACSDDTQAPPPPYLSMYATQTTNHEGHRMAGETPTNPAAPPAAPPPVNTGPDPQQQADLSEMRKLLAAEQAERKALQETTTRLELALRARDEEDAIRTVTVRLSELAKRFPPTTIEKLTGAKVEGQYDRARLLKLAAEQSGIDALEAVPMAPRTAEIRGAAGVSLHELGSGANADPESAYGQLRRFAEEARKANPRMTAEQARVQASEDHPELVAAYRSERQRRLPMVLEG